MAFLEHFGFRDHPFPLTPDTSRFYRTPEQMQILSAVMFALERGDGVLKIVGEIGTGKTLLCRILLHELDRTQAVAYLNAPVIAAHNLPAAVCREFGLEPVPGLDPVVQLTEFLVTTHAQRRRAILVVDEAQALGAAGLETIRLMSNLETDRRKLLQIVLFGQPELDVLLARHDLRQLLQRINFSFSTAPLAPNQSVAYIEYRLRRVLPANTRPPMARWLMRLIAWRAAGVPRVINILADKALLAAYADGARRVKLRHVAASLRDTEVLLGPMLPRWMFRAASAALALGGVGIAALVLHPQLLALLS